MEQADIINLQSEFTGYLNVLIHEATMPYYKSKKVYPINEVVLSANAYYACVLFDVAFGIIPSLEQIQESELSGAEASSLLASATFLYQNWMAKGIEKACDEYCDFINGAIDEQAILKTKDLWILLPDFKGKKNLILSKINEMKNPNYRIKSIDRIVGYMAK